MDYVSNPGKANIRVRLTEYGKKLYIVSLEQLRLLDQDDAVRLEGPVPEIVLPDSQGYYEMPFWIFVRAVGGPQLYGPSFLKLSVMGDIHFIITQQLPSAIIYPE